ncbi:MAG: sulfatase [Planctomycetota bacterium]
MKAASSPSHTALFGLGLCAALVLSACGRKPTETAEPIAHAGLDLERFASGGVDLPTSGKSLLEGNDWYIENAGEWVQMRGSVGHLDFWAGQPGPVDLGLNLKRAAFLPQDAEVEVFVNGESVGGDIVGRSADWMRLDVPADLVRPGHNRLRLESSIEGRPKDHIEGNGDTRSLSILLSDVDVDGGPRASMGDGLPLELAPGQGISLHMAPSEESRLTLQHSGGPLWIGIRDVATRETLDWTTYGGGDASAIDVPVDALAGRMVEIVVAADRDASQPARLEALDHVGRPAFDVLLVVVDTLRADLFAGVDMEEDLPGFERLISDGAAFTEAYSHAPMTLPSHTALFSSRYPHLSGVTNNWQSVPTELPLIAEWMDAAGFETRASISLGTLWTPMRGGGLERGFEEYLSTEDLLRGPAVNDLVLPLLGDLDPGRPSFVFAHYCDPHEPYNSARVGDRYCTLSTPDGRELSLQLNQWTKTDVEVDFESGGQVVLESEHEFKLRRLRAWDGERRLPLRFEQGAEGEFGTRFVAEVDASGSGRLELWVHDRPKSRTEAVARYREEIVYADRFVERLLDSLDASGRYDDTLIIFTSDHGEQLFEHGHFGHARHLYDAEIHVPLVIKPPKRMADALDALRARSSEVVSHVDVVPTVLDLLDLPALPGMIGRSLLDDADRLAFAETHRPESPRDLLAFRDGRFKLIHAPDDGTWELFDLQTDPLEQENLWEQRGAEFTDWAADLELFAEGRGPGLDPSELDEATRARLKALGYLEDDEAPVADDAPLPPGEGDAGR